MKQWFLLGYIMVLLMDVNAQNNETVVVLELFTSQGCSSCPPADKLLDTILQKHDDSVIGLSYHVDYWNYIGWKDPFAKKEFSDKQRNYGAKFKSRSIYTPQIVVNGKEHFVGSDKTLMNQNLKKYGVESASNKVLINTLNKEGEVLTFNYGIDGTVEDKTLSVILTIKKRITEIKRGENRNRVLKNSNIVVYEDTFFLKNKEGVGSIILPKIVTESDELALVLVVKNKNLEVTGAVQTSL